MREMTAEKQQLMDFDLLISSEKTHYESDLTIYYVLSGRMQVEMGETVLDLAEQDFLILNPFQLHAAELKEHALVMKFQVNPGMFLSTMTSASWILAGILWSGRPDSMWRCVTCWRNVWPAIMESGPIMAGYF